MEPPQGPPLTPYSGPPNPGWTPPGAGPSRSTSGLKVVVVVVVVFVALVAALGLFFFWWLFGGRGDALHEPLAPSERSGATPTTLPEGLELPEPSGLNRDEFGILDEEEAQGLDQVYNELGCVFAGTSVMDPPLSMSLIRRSGPHQMTLEPGASFECRDGTKEESAGTIGLDAVFESWTTILDGPYAGYKGRLVLESWEIVYDSSGMIAGVRFEPTEAIFGRS